MKYDLTNLASDYRFIRVTGEDGTFYDLVRRNLVRQHIALLIADGYTAEMVTRKSVPPCTFRHFGDDLGRYYEASWRDGTTFYFN